MKSRLFIAIDLPLETKSQISKLQAELTTLGLPVEWEAPEKAHLTLNFLGDAHHSKFPEIIGSTQEVVKGFAPFTLSPMFLETLYNRHEASLIYLGLAGDIEVLKDLQKALQKSLNSIEFPQPIRFLPHITIGRFKRIDPVVTKYSMDQVSNFDYKPLPEFSVNAVTIFKSLVSRQGSHYEKFREFSL